jgi:hypothetical protein
MHIDPALLSSLPALLGACIGGGASLAAAAYTQHYHDRRERVANEITKRESVYANFIMAASKSFLNAQMRDGIVLGADEQQLISLINRMRLFAPLDVVRGAEAVLKAIIEISLKPPVDLDQLAREALSKSPDPDPFLTFSLVSRADLDNVRRTLVRPTSTSRRKRATMLPITHILAASGRLRASCS